MKKLDSKGLFDIFSQGDEAIYEQHGVQHILDNAFVLFGMVVKGVENYYIIHSIYTHKFAQQYICISEGIKLKYFNQLITYLDRIDISQSDTVNQLVVEFDYQEVHSALNQLLHFYEQKEIYENCAIILKFLDIFCKK